jgi:hypothetical protein
MLRTPRQDELASLTELPVRVPRSIRQDQYRPHYQSHHSQGLGSEPFSTMPSSQQSDRAIIPASNQTADRNCNIEVFRGGPPVSAIITTPSDGTRYTAIAPRPKCTWTDHENRVLTNCRAQQLSWKDISKQLPGRSAGSCCKHYHTYLERPDRWSSEKKQQFASLYEK